MTEYDSTKEWQKLYEDIEPKLYEDSEPERYYDWMLWKLRQERKKEEEKKYIYESPDKGKTIYRREMGSMKKEKLVQKDKSPFIQYGKDEHEVYLSADAVEKLSKQNGTVSINDMVNHPPHYNKGIETNDYIKSWGMNYAQGNVIKYTTRYNLKHSDKRKQREDLAKAKWYLNDLITQLEESIED